MTRRYLVQCEETCPECGGHKSYNCDYCKGVGTVRREVDILEALVASKFAMQFQCANSDNTTMEDAE